IIGVIEVLDKTSGEDFNTADLKLLEAMADAAAVAIENVRLYEEERKKSLLLTQAYEELHRTYSATLQALTGLLDTRDAATHGHRDGSGYPLGLRGEAIPLNARIFTVIDAFDAITSNRPYSPRRTYDQALQIMTTETGTKFDPTVMEAFLGIPPEEWERIRAEF